MNSLLLNVRIHSSNINSNREALNGSARSHRPVPAPLELGRQLQQMDLGRQKRKLAPAMAAFCRFSLHNRAVGNRHDVLGVRRSQKWATGVNFRPATSESDTPRHSPMPPRARIGQHFAMLEMTLLCCCSGKRCSFRTAWGGWALAERNAQAHGAEANVAGAKRLKLSHYQSKSRGCPGAATPRAAPAAKGVKGLAALCVFHGTPKFDMPFWLRRPHRIPSRLSIKCPQTRSRQ